jgi:response regulator of citrate/malate metabolism
MLFHRVFVLSDDEVSNYLTSMVLQESGEVEHIDTFKDIEQAVEILKKSAERGLDYPDLIILQKHMKAHSAFEILDDLYDYDSFTSKTIIISTTFSEEDYKLGKKYDVIGFLDRPLTVEKFKELLSDFRK